MLKSKRSLGKAIKRFGDMFSSQRSSQQRKLPRSRFMQLEPLEQRQMLSGTSYEVDLLSDVVASDGYISLREAIQAANTNTAVCDAPAGSAVDTDEITFDSDLFIGGAQSITLGGTQLTISDDLDITGPGADLLSINGNGNRVFNIASGVTATISGLTITDGSAYTGAGISVGTDATVTISDSTITGNTATTYGGGIYGSAGSTITINNSSSISNNYTTAQSGAGIVTYGTLNVYDSTISGNESGYKGGGIALLGTSTATINNSLLSGNKAIVSAYGSGGGIYVSTNCAVTVENGSEISGNTVESSGGGIYGYTGSSITVEDSTVSLNTTTTIDGGGICSHGTVDIESSTISENDAGRYGGGIRGGSSSEITISDSSSITDNEANLDGGGIFTEGTLLITASTVLTNTSGTFGGGIRGGSSSEITISSSSSVSGNTATSFGGGIYITGQLEVNSSTISDNTSYSYGGGITGRAGSTITVTDSTISGNESTYGGGGIYAEANDTVDISNSSISDNTAGSTGGGVNATGDLTISGTTISGNSAVNAGGVYAHDVVISSSTIVGNTATTVNGGGVYGNTDSVLSIINTVISGNTADDNGGGVFILYGGAATVTNSTIAGNVATTDSGGGIKNLGTLTVNNSIVSLNTATSDDNISGNYTNNDSFVGGTPGFIRNPDPGDYGWDGTDDDYGNLRLTPGSAAIDAGEDDLAIDEDSNPLTTDLDGNPRKVDINGGADIVDQGAYEYQGEIIVTTLDDDDSEDPGTSDPYNQYISLREALAIAYDWAGDDTITFSDLLEGTVVLTGDDLDINSNVTIESPAAGLIIEHDITIASGVTATFYTLDTENTVTLSGDIDGLGGLTKTGTDSTLLLTGTNTYEGGTTVSEGTLQAKTANSLAYYSTPNEVAIANGGTIAVNGGSGGWTAINIDSLHDSADFVSGSTLAVDTTDAGGSLEYGYVVSRPTNFAKLGTGTLILTQTNTYTGTTTIEAGALQIGNGGSYGSMGGGNVTNYGSLVFNRSASLTVNNIIGGSGNLVQDGTGTLTLTGDNEYSGGTTINDGTIQVGNWTNTGTLGTGNVVNNASLTFSFLDTKTIANDISGSGTLVQDGYYNKTLILTGNNTYEGTTTINADSTLRLGSSTAMGTSAVAVNGTLDLNGYSPTLGRLSGADTGTVTSGAAGTITLTVGSDNQSSTFSGIIQDGSGDVALIKQGTGTLTLTGDNTYSSGTTINDGTIKVGNWTNTGALGTGNVVNNASLVFVRSNTATVAHTISGTGSVTQYGSGMLILTGNNTYSGGTTISGSRTLQVGNGGSTGTLGSGNVVGTGNLIFNRNDNVTIENVIMGEIDIIQDSAGELTLTGDISGAANVTQQGTGVLMLTGNNTYNGGTTIDEGSTLQVGSNTATGTGAVTVNGTLDLNGYNPTVGKLLGTGIVTSSIAGSTLNVSTNISQSHMFSGTIQDGTGTVALTKQGIGVLILSGTNTYSGITTISAGTLKVGNDSAVPSGSDNGNVVVDGTLDLNGHSITVNGLSGIGTVTSEVAGSITLTVGDNDQTSTFSGTIQDGTGTVALTKIGTGTLTLTGNSTYSGITDVQAGTLCLNGNISSHVTDDGGTVTGWFFRDPDLAAAVRTALGMPANAILTQGNLLELMALSADSNVISDLKGLENATNLKSLTLVPGDFSVAGHLSDVEYSASLEWLSSLTHLETLTLQDCGLTDTVLATLGNPLVLESLDVRYNNLAIIPESIANLPNLTSLYVYGNSDLADNPRTGLANLAGKLINVDLAPDHPEQATTIEQLADSLYDLPIEIYEYVVNTIEYQVQ